MYPEEIKDVVRARFPDSIKQYEDPTGDQVNIQHMQKDFSYDNTLLPDCFAIIQVYRVMQGDFARAKWPKPPHCRVSTSKK